MAETRLSVVVPSVAELRLLDRVAAMELLGQIERGLETLAAARGALQAVLLEPPPPPALLDAREVGRRLNMSEEWVRVHGAELDIEVDIGAGTYRYDPVRVEALRERRRNLKPVDDLGTRLKRKLHGG